MINAKTLPKVLQKAVVLSAVCPFITDKRGFGREGGGGDGHQFQHGSVSHPSVASSAPPSHSCEWYQALGMHECKLGAS